MIKIGIIAEGKNPPDERVPFSPQQCKTILDTYDVELFVQSSKVRRFKDQDYIKEGIQVVDDISHCDILFGVKEVPIDHLHENKTYFFFSHTIKKQPYNRKLLQAIIKKNIRLIDYECLRNQRGRIVGFGRYAGIVGAYNGLLAYGKRYGSFDLKPAYLCEDIEELKLELKKVELPAIKLCITGRGRVASGAIEVLDFVGIKKVSVDDYLAKRNDEVVYAQLAVTDYNKPKEYNHPSIQEFFDHPERFDSNFMRFAEVTDLYIAGHFWKEGSPFIFTRDEAKLEKFNIKVVADISCDIDGPVASTLRPSTIKDPLYGYDPITEKEVGFDDDKAITVMAVDNLPCELPKDASKDFGGELLSNVLPHLLSDDEEGIIKNATLTENGRLTEAFDYLTDYLNGKE